MNQQAIIITAPSGAGKTTIVRHLLTHFPVLRFSVSACTRGQRNGEIHGKDYYFITEAEFREKIAHDEFAEWEEVYPGNLYGTLKAEIERIWKENGVVIFDVDVKGALNLKKFFGDRALSVFIAPPSIEELTARLESRATETEEKIAMRVKKSEEEMKYQDSFDEKIINDTLEHALDKAIKLVGGFIQAS